MINGQLPMNNFPSSVLFRQAQAGTLLRQADVYWCCEGVNTGGWSLIGKELFFHQPGLDGSCDDRVTLNVKMFVVRNIQPSIVSFSALSQRIESVQESNAILRAPLPAP
jgi:hypothetical protein